MRIFKKCTTTKGKVMNYKYADNSMKNFQRISRDTVNRFLSKFVGIYDGFDRMLKEVKDDIKAVRERDPAAKSNVEIILLYSGIHAMLAYRVSHKLYISKHAFAARFLSQLARHFTGIEIHPGATIGKRLFIDHGMGVVIGETTEIGDDCTIYQGVTLGGTGKDTGKRHPTLGNNIMVGSGARVLGPVRIGDNSKIAAGAVVLKDIPENSTAVGIPARVVRQKGQKTCDNMDQINIPDPIAQELAKMCQRIKDIEHKLNTYKEKEKKRAEAAAKRRAVAAKAAAAKKQTVTENTESSENKKTEIKEEG